MASTSKYPVLSSHAPGAPLVTTTCTCTTPGGDKTRLAFAPPHPLPPSGARLTVRCWACGSEISHAFYPGQLSSSPSNPSTSTSSPSHTSQPSSSSHRPTASTTTKPKRRIGTQENPLETGYYEVLEVPIDAPTEQIKKAYRRLAIIHHPDKLSSTLSPSLSPSELQSAQERAAERFNEIAVAYQTLSDADSRRKYNEFGSKKGGGNGGEEGDGVDPEEVFSAMFGGERFEGVIGKIGLGAEMKRGMQEAEDASFDPASATPQQKADKEKREKVREAEKAKERRERIGKLVKELERKLGIFTESATGPEDGDVGRSWREICALEATSLAEESYGPELLACIGFVYTSKAKAFLASTQSFLGVGGWLHNVQGRYHVFSETVSTLRSAIELKTIFEQLQAAESSGNLSPEDKAKLEEQAAEKGVKALFKGAKLEIESVLRETCDVVLGLAILPDQELNAPGISRDKAVLRATALRMLGEAYTAAGASAAPGGQSVEGGAAKEEEEYVRVDTRASKAREAGR